MKHDIHDGVIGQIVKGFIIPKSDNNGNTIYTRVFTRKEYDELYEEYKKFLHSYIRFYKTVSKKSTFESGKDINEFLNALIFYIRSFTFLDIIPSELGYDIYTLSPSSSTLLRCYPFILSIQLDIFDGNELDELIKNLENLSEVVEKTGVLNELKELNKKGEELVWNHKILEFPADTRPGLNTSSLLLHMLTVSGIAIAIYLYRYQSRDDEDIATLRLVSLFHDVGKMKEWHKHQTISSDLLVELMKEHCRGDALQIIERASRIIKESGNRDQLYDIFKTADRLASSTDRLGHLIDIYCPTLYRKIKEASSIHNKDVYYIINDWNFWNQFKYEEIQAFTEEFCRNACKIDINNPMFSQYGDESNAEIKSNEVLIYRIDFRSIQHYIHSRNIRVMNGASSIVDRIVNVLIPFYLVIKGDMFAESVLYYGGGNITLVSPANIEGKLKECIDYFSKYKIRLQYGYSPLYNSFVHISSNIDRELTMHKLGITVSEDGYTHYLGKVTHNLMRLCSSCGREGVESSEIKEQEVETEIMCRYCEKKFNVGNKYHFEKRIASLLNINDKDERNKIKENIMEYIAGHNIKEIKEGIVEYKNIAYIKIDGNLTGLLMASSLSITDAYERSVRIDYSLKNAFHSFLLRLKDKRLVEYVNRIIMGVMYMGGDDAVLLVPSPIAIPLSLHLIREYNRNMGRRSTLSVGITAGKPKYPLYLLRECSDYLLEMTKDTIRYHAYNLYRGNDEIDFRGALSFWVNDSSIGKNELAFQINQVKEYTIQPYILSDKNDSRNIARLLDVIYQMLNDDNGEMVANRDTGLLNLLASDRIGLSGNHYERLKSLRRNLITTLYIDIYGSTEHYIKIIFASKEKINKGIYGTLVSNLLFNDGKRLVFALYDLYQLLKVMGVD